MLVITGASGRTGRVVAETLLARDERIRVVVRDGSKGSSRCCQRTLLALVAARA